METVCSNTLLQSECVILVALADQSPDFLQYFYISIFPKYTELFKSKYHTRGLISIFVWGTMNMLNNLWIFLFQHCTDKICQNSCEPKIANKYYLQSIGVQYQINYTILMIKILEVFLYRHYFLSHGMYRCLPLYFYFITCMTNQSDFEMLITFNFTGIM